MPTYLDTGEIFEIAKALVGQHGGKGIVRIVHNHVNDSLEFYDNKTGEVRMKVPEEWFEDKKMTRESLSNEIKKLIATLGEA